MSKKRLKRIFAWTLLVFVCNAFVPFHQLLHSHKYDKYVNELHIKKHENSCCSTSDAISIYAIIFNNQTIEYKLLISDKGISSVGNNIQRAIFFNNNKAPPFLSAA